MSCRQPNHAERGALPFAGDRIERNRFHCGGLENRSLGENVMSKREINNADSY